MKRIAIVIDSLVGGGAERVMITLAKTLADLGHTVEILSLSNQQEYEVPDLINVHYLFDHKATKVDRFMRINKSLKKLERWFAQREQFHLVLSNLDRSNNLLRQSHIKNVYFIIHNAIQEEMERQKKLGWFAYRYLFNSKRGLSGKRLICVSQGIEKEISDLPDLKPLSTRTIYNPFQFEQIQEQAKEADSQVPNFPFIVHVGRVAKQKRHDILFQALGLVKSDIKLVLLCNNVRKAKKLAGKYGVLDRVIFPGFQKNPYVWIKKAKAMVLSSDYEGFPTVLIEALAIGKNVVSTNCQHGPSEILTGPLSKFLVPRRNPELLAKAIEESLNFEIKETPEILTKIDAKGIARQYLSLID